MSAQAAMTDEPTMRANDTRVRPVTTPLNMNTSPYAMRMMVRFLKMLRGQLVRVG
jgi:hypothetical protein